MRKCVERFILRQIMTLNKPFLKHHRWGGKKKKTDEFLMWLRRRCVCAQLFSTNASAAACNMLSAAKCAAPVATGDEVDPRVWCSEAEQRQQLLQCQQREAVGSCGRRDAASQLRSPLRLWFSAFGRFSRKRQDFATT